MWDRLKAFFGKKSESSEPTLGEILVKMFDEEEAALREQARQSDSQALRVKLHARADQVRTMKLRVLELQK